MCKKIVYLLFVSESILELLALFMVMILVLTVDIKLHFVSRNNIVHLQKLSDIKAKAVDYNHQVVIDLLHRSFHVNDILL